MWNLHVSVSAYGRLSTKYWIEISFRHAWSLRAVFNPSSHLISAKNQDPVYYIRPFSFCLLHLGRRTIVPSFSRNLYGTFACALHTFLLPEILGYQIFVLKHALFYSYGSHSPSFIPKSIPIFYTRWPFYSPVIFHSTRIITYITFFQIHILSNFIVS